VIETRSPTRSLTFAAFVECASIAGNAGERVVVEIAVIVLASNSVQVRMRSVVVGSDITFGRSNFSLDRRQQSTIDRYSARRGAECAIGT
jgi:hypothetical protein